MKSMRKIGIFLFCILLVASLSATSLAAPSFMSTVADGTGNTVALLYTTAAGIVTRIDLYYDPAVSDYGSVSTTGSIAWALSSSGGNLAPGGKLHLSDGTFLVATPLVDSNPMFWEGESRAATIIQANGIGSSPAVNVTSSNVSFQHLTINGNGQGGVATNVSTLQVNNLGPTALSGFTANDILVENGIGNGLGIFSVSNVLVTNSSFIGNGLDQLLIDSNPGQPFNNVQIIGNVTDDAGGGSSCFVSLFIANDYAVAESGVVVSNNIIRYRGLGSHETDGFVYDGGTTSQVTVSGNVITMTSGSSTAGSCVEICGVSDITLTGNTCYNSNQGLDFNCTSSSGVVSNNVVDTCSSLGITVSGSSSNLQFLNNQILNSSTVGIQVYGGSVLNIDQNIIYGPSPGITMAAGLSGTSGGISNNTITNTATASNTVAINTANNSNWKVLGNTVTLTQAGSSSSGILVGGSNTDVRNNQVFLSTNFNGGISLTCDISAGCTDNTVSENSIYGTSGTWAVSLSQYAENNFTISNNHIASASYGIVYGAPSSTNSIISNNTVGTLSGGTKYSGIPATGVIVIDTQTPVTFANLLSPVPAAGSQMMCSNCKPSLSACASGGSGALAVSNRSSWLCP